jgi:hypothetical protein
MSHIVFDAISNIRTESAEIKKELALVAGNGLRTLGVFESKEESNVDGTLLFDTTNSELIQLGNDVSLTLNLKVVAVSNFNGNMSAFNTNVSYYQIGTVSGVVMPKSPISYAVPLFHLEDPYGYGPNFFSVRIRPITPTTGAVEVQRVVSIGQGTAILDDYFSSTIYWKGPM